MIRRMAKGMTVALLLAVLVGCVADQRYVNTDGACAAMPCHKRAWTDGVVNE